MKEKRHVAWLKKRGACEEGLAFARTQPTMQAAWDNCPDPYWLVWLMIICIEDPWPTWFWTAHAISHIEFLSRKARADMIRELVPHFTIPE